MKFTVYRKPTHTGTYLHYNSNNPVTHKNSVALSLFARSKNLCDPEFKFQEDQLIRKTLIDNGYPSRVINHCYRNVNFPSSQSPQNRENNIKYVKTPYIKGATERITRLLKPFSISVASKPSNNIRSILGTTKDKLSISDKNSIIYKIPCSDCSECYVGESGKEMKVRNHEHQLAVARNDPRSLISQHVLRNGHDINWDAAEVLDSHKNSKSRKVLEAMYTSSIVGSFNRCIDVPQTYLNVANQVL